MPNAQRGVLQCSRLVRFLNRTWPPSIAQSLDLGKEVVLVAQIPNWRRDDGLGVPTMAPQCVPSLPMHRTDTVTLN